MRKRHWLACLLSMWMSVVGGQASAQPPNLPNDVSNPDLTGMLPPPYNTNYGTYPPQSYGGMPGGYPPGANAWPNITPYGPLEDQTTNENGLWFNRLITGNRKYYFTAEGLIGRTRHPSNFVGDPQANTLPKNFNFQTGGYYFDHNQQFLETPQVTSLFGNPDRSLFGTGGGGGGGGAAGGGTDYPIFVGQSTGSITDALDAGGARMTWGWWNPDQSGFQASGFFLAPSATEFFLGDLRPFDFNYFGNLVEDHLVTHLHAFAGLPLSGADSDQDSLPGVVMPFDIYYRLQYETQTASANAEWFATPILERNAFKIRPSYGAKYVGIKEAFIFDAADSGLGYTIQPPTNRTTAGGGGGGGGGGGNQTARAGFLSPLLLQPGANVPNVMQSYLYSTVTTQLAGPEIGVRFDVGNDDRFSIFTQSKFGLLVNNTSRQINGFNIGDAYYQTPNAVLNDSTVMPRNNPAATRFAHSQNTTRLSPMFEQSIFGQAKLFKFVPILKKSKILSGADFQAGYTMILLGNMDRPSNIIDWQAYPVNPQLKDERGSFFTSNYSFGVQWEY